jgi:hypothetical protein
MDRREQRGFAIDDFKGKAISFQMKSKGANNNSGSETGGRRRKQLRRQTSRLDGIRAIGPPSTYRKRTSATGGAAIPCLGPIKDIYFAISAGDGGAGELLLSDLRMGVASKEGNIGKGGMIFNGQSKEGWMVAKGEGSSIWRLEIGAGEKGGQSHGVEIHDPRGSMGVHSSRDQRGPVGWAIPGWCSG